MGWIQQVNNLECIRSAIAGLQIRCGFLPVAHSVCLNLFISGGSDTNRLTPCSVASTTHAIFNRLGRTKFLTQLIGLAAKKWHI